MTMEITKLIEEVERLKPGLQLWWVSTLGDNDYLLSDDLKKLASLAEDALRYEKMMGETVSMVFTEGIAIAHLDSDIWALNHKWADQTFDTALDAFESLAGKEE